MSRSGINRRQFLRGAAAVPEPSLRPPWVGPQDLQACTSCGDCVSACPEGILRLDDARLPFVDFSDTGCTFCGDCAAACTHGVFGDTQMPAWQTTLTISNSCLMNRGVSCQVCTDFCDTQALRFDLSRAPVGALRVVQDNCTSCGMCVGACPVAAISLDLKIEASAA